MRLIGRLLAIVLVLIVPLLLMAASCNLAIYNTMSNEQTYRDAFADRSLLDDIRPYAIPALFDAGAPADTATTDLSMQSVIDTIDMKNWETVMGDVVSVAWMQDRFDQLLRLFTGIIDDDYATLDESIDTESVQARLQGDSSEAIASKILSFSPRCTVEEEELLTIFNSTSAGVFPLCISADEGLQAFSLSHVTAWVDSLGTQMKTATVTQFYGLGSAEARGLHIILKLDEQSSYVTYLCPGALLALIVFFVVRSFSSFTRWIGGTLFLSGIGVLVALVAIQFFFVNVFSAATQSMSENDRLFTQIVVSLMRAGMGGISQSMLLQAALMILAGFGLFAITTVIGRTDLVSTGTTVLVTDDGEVISSASLPQIPETGSSSRRTASSQLKGRSDDAPLSS